jgi:hypothetical protein
MRTPAHIEFKWKEHDSMSAVAGGFWTSTGTILVLFILLVIVSRTILL